LLKVAHFAVSVFLYASIPLQNLSAEGLWSKVEMTTSLLHGGSLIGSQNYNWRLHVLVNRKLSKIYITGYIFLEYFCHSYEFLYSDLVDAFKVLYMWV